MAILFRKSIPLIHNLTAAPHGRFLIITVSLKLISITFVTIYAPNFDDPIFLKTFLTQFLEFQTLIQLSLLDNQFSRILQHSNSGNRLNSLMNNLNLVDIWRPTHPTERLLFLFSNPQDLFTYRSLGLGRSKKAENPPTSISDPAALSMVLKIVKIRNNRCICCFNPSMFSNKEFTEYIQEHIYNIFLFFKENNASEVNNATLCTSLRAVIRGYTISFFLSHKQKKKTTVH